MPEPALQVGTIPEQAQCSKRDLLTPTVLAGGGVLTLAWTALLGWGAVSLVSSLLS